MKLVYCTTCGDVVRLVEHRWRQCECELVGGQYNKDGMTATIGGHGAKVFGIANPFFQELWHYVAEEQRVKFREAHKYGPGDCWWGGFKGDTQLFWITDGSGPRLNTRVKSLGLLSNKITIIDKRPYWIDGEQGRRDVVVPSNPKPSFKGKK